MTHGLTRYRAHAVPAVSSRPALLYDLPSTVASLGCYYAATLGKGKKCATAVLALCRDMYMRSRSTPWNGCRRSFRLTCRKRLTSPLNLSDFLVPVPVSIFLDSVMNAPYGCRSAMLPWSARRVLAVGGAYTSLTVYGLHRRRSQVVWLGVIPEGRRGMRIHRELHMAGCNGRGRLWALQRSGRGAASGCDVAARRSQARRIRHVHHGRPHGGRGMVWGRTHHATSGYTCAPETVS